LFSNPIKELDEEFFQTILENPDFLLEQIISKGQATREGQWLEQERAEWVLLLSGEAGLRFEHLEGTIEMAPGDHILIAANQRHRVEWTSREEKTVWLALHFSEE